MEIEDDDDYASWPDWEENWETTEGSGFGKAADKMIHRPYVALASMWAGNSSTKLRKDVTALVQKLLQLDYIRK